VHLEPLVTVLVTILVLPVTILSPGVILKLFAPLLEQVCRNGADWRQFRTISSNLTII
jgi:hypothetical protein